MCLFGFLEGKLRDLLLGAGELLVLRLGFAPTLLKMRLHDAPGLVV